MQHIIRALPLCCGLFLMAADARECTIHIVTDNGGGGGSEGEGEGEGDDGGACVVDGDCASGQVCQHDTVCPACPDPAQPCPDLCIINDSGHCVDADPGRCAADADCGPDAFCDFSQCGNGTPSAGNAPIACSSGVCAPVPPPPPLRCDQVLCSPDTHCVDSPEGPQCIPNDGRCLSDADCGDHQVCHFDANSSSGVCLTVDPPPPAP